jgi:hypothetical protein
MTFKNVYIHKSRLGFLVRSSNLVEFNNVYDTAVAGSTLTLGGVAVRGTFIQYSYGTEQTYSKNIYQNCNEPQIANNYGNTSYMGGYMSIQGDKYYSIKNAHAITVQGDNITLEKFTDTAGTVKSTVLQIKEGKLQLTGLPTYADNTAATTGGLTVGNFYKTSTGQLMIVY